MKCKLYLFLVFIVLFSSTKLFAFELKPLTKEELRPWCQNKMIWDRFNVTEEQCLQVAIPCSKKAAKPGMDLVSATEALYSCAFKELNIEIPDYPGDNF